MDVIVNVCILKENQLLMVQEASQHIRGLWNFPAGHLEEGENIFAGAIREAKEETGFDVQLTGIVDIQNCVFQNRHVILIHFTAEIVGGQIDFDTDEILDVKWIDVDKLLNMTDKQLRGEQGRKVTIQKLLANKVYPLEIVSNFNYRK